MKNTYVFLIKRNLEHCRKLGVNPEHGLTLEMTQSEFEDYQFLKTQIHDALPGLGIPQDEDVSWYENPPVTKSFSKKLLDAICAGKNAQLIGYYPHSHQHRTYKDIVVDGVGYKYMAFQEGLMIKFAPAITKFVDLKV